MTAVGVAILLATFAALATSVPAGLTLVTNQDHGDILADELGNVLYLFTPDAQAESTCYDTCALNWPPVVVDGDVALGEGIDAALVSAVTRSDGGEQVTYGGWPLYRFAGDTEPGTTNGQGLNDVWFVIAADGNAVGVAAESDAPAEAETTDAETTDDATAEDDLFATYMNEGAQVFANICAACHGAQGNEQLASHVAILEDNSRLENERRVLTRIIHGGGYMPGFGQALNDRQVAAVATFVRNSFGNEFGFVGEEAAAAIR